MGNIIRTPKTRYFKHGSISFYVQNKQIHYKIKLWNKEGTSHFVFEDAKFEGITVDEILAEVTQQTFTNVEVEQ